MVKEADVELPQWAKIQQKTFTNWVNVHLADRNLKIHDLAADLSDGIMLLNLLEVISAKRFGRYNKTTKFQSQKLENVATALKFLKDEGIKLVAIGPEDVVEKRIKLILGLIWTIILRWQIQKITDSSNNDAKAELIAWVNSVIPHNPVKNLKKDWQDGKALAALTNYLVPGSVETSPDDDALSLTTKAVNAADKEAQVPPVISPEDIVSPDLDELSMMTYVAMYRDRANQLRSGDPSKFEAYGPGLKKPVTGKRNQFTVEARNSAGERVKAGGHPVNSHFVPKGSLDSQPSKVKDAKDGTYPVAYIPRKAGEYEVHVQVGDVPIKNSPFLVTVNDPIPIDVANSTVDPNISEKEDSHPRLYYTTVITRNGSGELIPYGGATIVATIVPTNGKDEIDSVVEDLDDGTYEIVFRQPPAGQYKVSVGLPDPSGEKVSQHVTNSPFNFSINENGEIESNVPVPSPGLTTVDGDGVTQGKTDKPAKFTIHARDVNGKDIPALPIHFVASVTDPEGNKHNVELRPEGDLLVGDYTPEVPGDYTVAVDVVAIKKTPQTPVKDSPFTVPVKASANASRTQLTGPGIADSAPVTTEPAKYTVTSYDKDGNPLAHGGEDVQAFVKNPDGSTKPLDVTDNGDGTYSLTHAPEGPGEHAIHVKLGDDEVNNSPAVIDIVDAPSADNTVVEGPGVEKGKTDKPSAFKVHAKNAKGEPIPALAPLYTATVTDPAGNTSPIALKPDGDSLVGEYTPEEPGNYTVQVNVKDPVTGAETPVNGSPFEVPVSVSASAANSKLSGPGITDKDTYITTTEPTHFTIHSFDKNGNPLTQGGEEFDVSIDGPAKVSHDVKDNGDGTYEVSYAPTEPGQYTISVKYDNEDISNSPATVDVEEGADEEASFAVDYMFTIEAKTKSGATRVRGGDKFEVTITSKEGVEVEGVKVEDLAAEGNPGKYRVWYTLPGEGKYLVKATLNGKNIKGSPWKQSL